MKNSILKMIKAEKLCAKVFEKSGRNSFRDRVTVYFDGKVLFERYCYGESAGIVFKMWNTCIDDNGAFNWDYNSCQNSKKTEAPTAVTGVEKNVLTIDDKQWNCVENLKTDGKNGYNIFKVLFSK